MNRFVSETPSNMTGWFIYIISIELERDLVKKKKMTAYLKILNERFTIEDSGGVMAKVPNCDREVSEVELH